MGSPFKSLLPTNSPRNSPVDSAKARQSRQDQEPTVTSKSSGLQYVEASPSPAQEKSVQRRENATKNDK
jgi:hypothetical protein